jgi:hypothetical protein
MKLLECEIEYFPNFHLMQLYSGFFELHRKGIIDLKIKPVKKNKKAYAVINALINKKHRVVYDMLDGLTWIPGDVDVNLEYFRQTYKTDFYFKRSFSPSLLEHSPENCKVFPLGLNYNVQPSQNLFRYSGSLRDKFKYFVKTNKLLKKVSAKSFFYEQDFEYYPVKPSQKNVLFLTRLWDPADAKSQRSVELRTRLNKTRVECIERCRKEFGADFTGGLAIEKLATKDHASLIMPESLTSKANYLQAVKEHAICIATTGLHHSIGWKMAEYVAASRGIVSEPLKFQLPGNFEREKNFYEFETADQLIDQINRLRTNNDELLNMMRENHHYYNNFVKPENLVMNTLLTVLNETGGI